jgi:hypothetical protein
VERHLTEQSPERSVSLYPNHSGQKLSGIVLSARESNKKTHFARAVFVLALSTPTRREQRTDIGETH